MWNQTTNLLQKIYVLHYNSHICLWNSFSSSFWFTFFTLFFIFIKDLLYYTIFIGKIILLFDNEGKDFFDVCDCLIKHLDSQEKLNDGIAVNGCFIVSGGLCSFQTTIRGQSTIKCCIWPILIIFFWFLNNIVQEVWLEDVYGFHAFHVKLV